MHAGGNAVALVYRAPRRAGVYILGAFRALTGEFCHLPLTREVAKPQVLTEGEIHALLYDIRNSLPQSAAQTAPSSEGA